jgi:hypothetical protein
MKMNVYNAAMKTLADGATEDQKRIDEIKTWGECEEAIVKILKICVRQAWENRGNGKNRTPRRKVNAEKWYE